MKVFVTAGPTVKGIGRDEYDWESVPKEDGECLLEVAGARENEQLYLIKS
jgi:hypothetical protein